MEKDGVGIGDEVAIKVIKGIQSGCKLVGHWKTTVFDKDGNIKETDEGWNQVTLIVFNAAGAGVMFFYAEGSHVMTAPDTLQIDWTFSVSH